MQGSSSGCDYSNGDSTNELGTDGNGGVGGSLRSSRHQFVNSSATTITKRSSTDAGLTMTSSTGLTSEDDEDEDVDDVDSSPPPVGQKMPPAKKTKGRVKIKMEFIDNKLRRYTTFSKRKTGIMKKAYELSTLTGTQVMLLVASETGHVYTFATRKLQPMITSEAGKALIQTCLNSPDPLLNCGSSNNGDGGICGGDGGGVGVGSGGGGGGGGNGNGHSGHVGGIGMTSDQRMSATGFEETEFTYSINDDEQKVDNMQGGGGGGKSHGPFSGVGSGHLDSGGSSSSQSPTLTDLSSAATTVPVSSALFVSNSSKSSPLTVKTVQIPSAPTFTTSGQSNAAVCNASAQQNSVMMVPTSQQGLSMIKGSVVNVTSVGATQTTSSVPGAVMYQTPQGFLYATPTSATPLPEGVLFNFGQLQQQAGAGSSAQQYITIPVSLTPAAQIVHGVNLDGRGVCKNSVTDLSKGGAKK